MNEVKGKIPNITNLATTSSLTAVGNKISSFSNLVKKNDYNTKINEIEKKITNPNHDKYITTPLTNKNELNELLKKLKAISTKGLTKNLIDKLSILNGAKYFSLGIL